AAFAVCELVSSTTGCIGATAVGVVTADSGSQPTRSRESSATDTGRTSAATTLRLQTRCRSAADDRRIMRTANPAASQISVRLHASRTNQHGNTYATVAYNIL